MKIIVLDTETTLHSERPKESATPHDPNNSIVWFGYQYIQDGNEGEVVTLNILKDLNLITTVPRSELLVGSNIKFDLHYMRKSIPSKRWMQWLADGGQVWDIQLAEYILTGQQSKMASLDNMSKKYGLPVKDSKMAEYWNKGVSTEDIPDEEIVPYLEQDVTNTKEIFYKQVQQAQELGMLPLIRTQMDALLAAQEMEYNGMYVDEAKLLSLQADKEAAHKSLHDEILVAASSVLDNEVLKQFNLNSATHLAHLFYGTPLTLKIDKDTGTVYKSGLKKGLKKTKKEEVIYVHNKGTRLPTILTPSGKIQVSIDTINNISKDKSTVNIIRSIAKKVGEYKKLEKELSTYINPMLNLRWGHDSCIHHTLNQCLTATGRFSSSKPNLQNIPREGTADVKDAFTSRYGKDGLIFEIDFSQLEVIGLAHLSMDTQLLYDVSHGVDMHLKNAAVLFGIPESKVTKEQRRQAKVGTFQLQYGAGAKTISEESGLTLTQAKALVDAYYSRYPGIKKLHAAIAKEVKLSRKGTRRFTENGIPSGTGTYISQTGRRYHFHEYDSPMWLQSEGQLVGFSPTEMKNYPVQGFATADIVPMMLGKVLKNVMVNFPTVKMINTVHDSLLFDCPKNVALSFTHAVTEELNKTNEYLQEIFGIEVSVPFGFDVEVGHNWGSKK